MTTRKETVMCPECGRDVDTMSLTLECEHCLSKRKE